ncbi:MAG: protein translocase subunit SecD, partial [Sphingomonadales bacterium]|nr:protein translocase subunit SecD [Sphingomonadales bacterium]
SLSDSIKDLRSKRLSVSRIKMVGNEALSFYYRKAEEKEAILKEIRPLAIIDPSNPFGANQRDFEITEDDENQAITLTLTEFGVDKRKRDAVSQVISVLGKRIDPEGTKELSIQPSGSDRVILQIPGETNPDQVINLIKTQAKLTFHMVDETATQSDINRGRVKPSSMIVDHYDGDVPIGKIAIERRVMLTGQNLKSAKVTFDQNNTTVVGFVFDVAGGKKFGDITIKYTNKRFAIKLDDRVISSPRINEPILGGSGIITGNYTVDSAQELVTLMNAGALPADLAILEQSTVGPDLGKDSIEAGEKAVIIGFLAVIVYMAISYGLFGLLADVALIANVVIIVGVLTLLQATLTLPGIAGIVLTIGMAVDANVL